MQNTNKQNCFIFDLDGTLANGNGRDFYSPKHKEILNDLIIDPVDTVLQALLSIGHKVIFLSGREDKYYKPTEQWIQHSLMIAEPELYMRKTSDSRKDAVVKLEIYNRDILPKYNVIAVFDDRLQVCHMWYNTNVFCFNVNQGLKNF